MKCLSVRQPYAALIVSGSKSIETRTWQTKYRGPLLIQASMRPDAEAFARLSARIVGDAANFHGAIVGIVDLVDCRPLTPEDSEAACYPYDEGRYAWVLENPRALATPVPFLGKLGLFEIDSQSVKDLWASTG